MTRFAALLLAFFAMPAFSQAVSTDFRLEAISGHRKTNKNYIPPPDLAPFWHALNDQNGAVDDEPAFAQGGSCTFNLLNRVSDPEARQLTLSGPSGSWPAGCTADYTTGQVSGSPTTIGSNTVTVRACDPLPAQNCTNQVFSWTVTGIDTTAPTVPGTPTLVSQTASQVVIQWTASSDASGIDYYEVHRALTDCAQTFSLASGGTVDGSLTQFTHTNNQDVVRCYKVRAVDNAGNVSSFSSTYLNPVFNGDTPDTIVAVDGSDISAAWAAASPGDIIEIRTSSPGGTQTTTEAITCTNKDGTNGNEITIRVRAGDNVIIDAALYSLDVTGCDYWVLDGTDSDRSGLTLGDFTDWNVSTTTYNQDRGMNIDGSANHFELRNMTFHGGDRGVSTCNLIDRTTSVFRLSNVKGDLCGGADGEGHGDLLRVTGFNFIIEDSEFTHGGHNTLIIYGGAGVVRDTLVSGNWLDKGTAGDGSRAMHIAMPDQRNWQPDNVRVNDFGPLLFEHSDVRDNRDGTIKANPAFKMSGKGIIFRDTIIQCGENEAIRLMPFNDIGTATGEMQSRGKFYNNTVSGCDAFLSTNDAEFVSAMGAANGQRYSFKNNILASIDLGTNGTNPMVVYWDANLVGASTQLNGHANAWKGSEWIANNLSGSSTQKTFKLTGVGAATAAWDNCAVWPTNICDNTLLTPTFVNQGARTRAGLQVTAGSAVGNADGTHLTTTSDSGMDDTTLILVDPYYFYAGADPATWNLSYFGEVGDDICVGIASTTVATDAQPTRIVSINYSTGSTVVTPGVTHVANSKVWKRTQGSTTCADAWDGRGIQTP
jgi:hypothetical protein